MVKFSAFGFLQSAPEEGKDLLGRDAPTYTADNDLDQCVYYLKTLSNILRWSSDSMWAVLGRNNVSIDSSQKALYHISKCSVSV